MAAGNHRYHQQRGFSLAELMIVLAILTVVMSVVVGDIMMIQQRYRAEENRLDSTQQARELLDQFSRDLHQAGYPAATMFQPGVLMNPATNDSRLAAGLVSVSATDVWFEGDVDGDGQVESVRYTLQTDANGNCPCTVQRSSVIKANATAPLSQTVTYYTALEGLVNSGGAGGPGPNGSLDIAGSMPFRGPGGSVTNIANNTLYGAYRSVALFTAFDQSGNPVALPVSLSSDPVSLSNIRTIRITLNVLSATPDQKTGMRSAATLTATAGI